VSARLEARGLKPGTEVVHFISGAWELAIVFRAVSISGRLEQMFHEFRNMADHGG
jgi:hypothetical protein